MDFEFSIAKDRPVAVVQEEQRIIGDWLTYEIGNDKYRVKVLLDICDLLKSKGISEYNWQGRNYCLQVEQLDVLITGSVLLDNSGDTAEMEDFLSFDDSEHKAECGLEDFQELLSEWFIFIQQI